MKSKKISQKNITIIISLLILDQVTKYFAKAGTILFETGWLSFTFVKNTGVAFGKLQGMNSYLIWIYIILIGGIIYYFPKFKENEKIAFTLILTGAIGNLIDRILHGYVIDFINLHWWPVFNVADSCISIGIFWLVVSDFSFVQRFLKGKS